MVAAVDVGGRRRRDGVAEHVGARQRDRLTSDRRLAGLADAIGVRIGPADSLDHPGVENEPGVEAVEHLTRSGRDRAQVATDSGVGVERRVAHPDMGELPVRRQIRRVEGDRERSGRNLAGPVARRIGGEGGREGVALHVLTRHRHVDAGLARLAGVLDAVAVEILPHEVTDGDGFVDHELRQVRRGGIGLVRVDIRVVHEDCLPRKARRHHRFDGDRAGLADRQRREGPADVLAGGRGRRGGLDRSGAGRHRGSGVVRDAVGEVIGDDQTGEIGLGRVGHRDVPVGTATSRHEGQHLPVWRLGDLDADRGQRRVRSIGGTEPGRACGRRRAVGALCCSPGAVRRVRGRAGSRRGRVADHHRRPRGEVAEVPAQQRVAEQRGDVRLDCHTVDRCRAGVVGPPRRQHVACDHRACEELTGVGDRDAPRRRPTDRDLLAVVRWVVRRARRCARGVRHLRQAKVGRQEPDHDLVARAVVFAVRVVRVLTPLEHADVDGVLDRRFGLRVGPDGCLVGELLHLPGPQRRDEPRDRRIVGNPALRREPGVAGERHVGEGRVRTVLDRHSPGRDLTRVANGDRVVDHVAGSERSGAIRRLLHVHVWLADSGREGRLIAFVEGRLDRCARGRRDHIVLVRVAASAVDELIAHRQAGARRVGVHHVAVYPEREVAVVGHTDDLVVEHADRRRAVRIGHRAERHSCLRRTGNARRCRAVRLVDRDIVDPVGDDVGVGQIVVDGSGRQHEVDVVVSRIVRRHHPRARLAGHRSGRRVDDPQVTGVGEREAVVERPEGGVEGVRRRVGRRGRLGGRRVGVGVPVDLVVGHRDRQLDVHPRGALTPIRMILRNCDRALVAAVRPLLPLGVGRLQVERPLDDGRVAWAGRAMHDVLGEAHRVAQLIGERRGAGLVQRRTSGDRPVLHRVGDLHVVDREALVEVEVHRERRRRVGGHGSVLRRLRERRLIDRSGLHTRRRRSRLVRRRRGFERHVVRNGRTDRLPAPHGGRLAARPLGIRRHLEGDAVRPVEGEVAGVRRSGPLHRRIPQRGVLAGSGLREHPQQLVALLLDVPVVALLRRVRRDGRLEQRRGRLHEIPGAVPRPMVEACRTRNVAPSPRQAVGQVDGPQLLGVFHADVDVVFERVAVVHGRAAVALVEADRVTVNGHLLPAVAVSVVGQLAHVGGPDGIDLLGHVQPGADEVEVRLRLTVPRHARDRKRVEVVDVVGTDARLVHEASPEVGVRLDPKACRPPGKRGPRLEAGGVGLARSQFGELPRDLRAVGRRGVHDRGRRRRVREHLPAHRVAVHRVRGRAVIEVDVVRRAGTEVAHRQLALDVRDAERGFLDRLGLAVGARRRRCLAGAMARLGDANVRRARSEGGGRLPAVVHAVRPPVVLPPGPHTAQQRIRVVQVHRVQESGDAAAVVGVGRHAVARAVRQRVDHVGLGRDHLIRDPKRPRLGVGRDRAGLPGGERSVAQGRQRGHRDVVGATGGAAGDAGRRHRHDRHRRLVGRPERRGRVADVRLVVDEEPVGRVVLRHRHVDRERGGVAPRPLRVVDALRDRRLVVALDGDPSGVAEGRGERAARATDRGGAGGLERREVRERTRQRTVERQGCLGVRGRRDGHRDRGRTRGLRRDGESRPRDLGRAVRLRRDHLAMGSRRRTVAERRGAGGVDEALGQQVRDRSGHRVGVAQRRRHAEARVPVDRVPGGHRAAVGRLLQVHCDAATRPGGGRVGRRGGDRAAATGRSAPVDAGKLDRRTGNRDGAGRDVPPQPEEPGCVVDRHVADVPRHGGGAIAVHHQGVGVAERRLDAVVRGALHRAGHERDIRRQRHRGHRVVQRADVGSVGRAEVVVVVQVDPELDRVADGVGVRTAGGIDPRLRGERPRVHDAARAGAVGVVARSRAARRAVRVHDLRGVADLPAAVERLTGRAGYRGVGDDDLAPRRHGVDPQGRRRVGEGPPVGHGHARRQRVEDHVAQLAVAHRVGHVERIRVARSGVANGQREGVDRSGVGAIPRLDRAELSRLRQVDDRRCDVERHAGVHRAVGEVCGGGGGHDRRSGREAIDSVVEPHAGGILERIARAHAVAHRRSRGRRAAAHERRRHGRRVDDAHRPGGQDRLIAKEPAGATTAVRGGLEADVGQRRRARAGHAGDRDRSHVLEAVGHDVDQGRIDHLGGGALEGDVDGVGHRLARRCARRRHRFGGHRRLRTGLHVETAVVGDRREPEGRQRRDVGQV